MSVRRLAHQWLRYVWAIMPLGHTHLCFRSAGIDLLRGRDTKDGGGIGRAAALAGRPGGRIDHSKQSNQVPFRESRLRYVPSGSFHLGQSQTNGGEIMERRCCLGPVALDISLPASTYPADTRIVGEAIERSATSTAPPFRFSPEDVAEQAEQNRRPCIKSEKSPLLRRRHCSFSAVVDQA